MNNLCASAFVVHQFLQNTRIQNSQERFHVLFYFIFSLRCAGMSVRCTLGHRHRHILHLLPSRGVMESHRSTKSSCNLDY